MTRRKLPAGRVFLHDEIAAVLRERDNRWMTSDLIAAAINDRGLFRSLTGAPVTAKNVRSRLGHANYRPMFERNGRMIRLAPDMLDRPHVRARPSSSDRRGWASPA